MVRRSGRFPCPRTVLNGGRDFGIRELSCTERVDLARTTVPQPRDRMMRLAAGI
jgi:hypothetical protein